MNKIKLILCLCLYHILAFTQSKYDYNWVIPSHYDNSTPEAEGFWFKFQEGGVQIINITSPDEIFRQGSTISSKDGDLLFYTNGCAVYNREYELMQNGDGLNSQSNIYDQYCPGGYPGKADLMSLPDPDNEEGYYIIHKPITLTDNVEAIIETLNYTYVNMNFANGMGAVTKKNEIIYNDPQLLKWGFLNACKHANNKDWWILQLIDDTNTFVKILLDKDGFSIIDTQSVGPVFIEESGGKAQTVFNRDGSKYVIHSPEHNVVIYDFDRATGALSIDTQIDLIDDSVEQVKGASFSPNNRFLYVNTLYTLYQVDMWADVLIPTIVGEWDGFTLPGTALPISFDNMKPGPDCKIYLTPPSGVRYMHVINSPDEKGKACDFQQHVIELDYSLPASFSLVLPFYRMGEDMPCDPNLQMVNSQEMLSPTQDYQIYPNPVSETLYIYLHESSKSYTYQLYSMSGALLSQGALNDSVNNIDIRELKAGLYILQLIDSNGELSQKKILKE